MKLRRILTALKESAREVWQELNLVRSAFVCGSLGGALTFLAGLLTERFSMGSGAAFGILLIPMGLLAPVCEEFLKQYLNKESQFMPPGSISRFFSLLLPKRSREQYFIPSLEEMKEDRIREEAEAVTDFKKVLIKVGFPVKVTFTFLFTLLCLFHDSLAKIIPVLKWFFTGTMR